MAPRRALIIAPLYDGKLLPPLAGRSTLVERLTTCIRNKGNYDVKVLDRQVEPPDFRQAIHEFFQLEGELLFYFYGHGCLQLSGLGAFATSSARANNEGILMIEVISSAMNSPAREVVLILDCCHAGAAAQVNDIAISGLSDQVIRQPGRVLLAGCASHQSGWEIRSDDEQKKIGAFSYYILKGLEGEARAGSNKVRGSMLGTYVTEVFQAWNQNPIVRNSETGDRQCIIVSGFPSDNAAAPSSSPKTEPIIIGVPFKPSQLFVGRSAEIDSLRTMLESGSRNVAVSATVEGLGGIGKTELVLQLIHDGIQATYNTIIWLDAAGPLPPQWEKVVIELGMSISGEAPVDLIHQVGQELRRRSNSLIILDNASEWSPISQLIPSGIALLVTTRTQGFGGNSFRHIELSVLSEESATDFLIQMVPELENDPSLPHLVHSLEGHALALELAGWNIKYMGLSAQEYIQRLNQHQADYSRALAATKYGKAVDSCLSITWDGLHLDASRTLWRRASLFAPTSAHRDLLRVSFGGDRDTRRKLMWMLENEFEDRSLSTLLGDPEAFHEAYAELRAFHVLARVEGFNGERWAMHRLVRDYGRARLKPGEVLIHAISLSEWLREPTLPLEPEIPHFVATVLDSARYNNELTRMGRRFEREILFRSLSGRNRFLFNPSEFINYIRDQLQDPKALTIILEGLTDINQDVRVLSIQLLENVGSIPEVLDGLTASLDDPDTQVRDVAGRTLAEHGGDKTVEILSAALQSSKQRARLAAVRALGLMGQKAHNALKKALISDDSEVCIEAAFLLCEQGQQEGSQILLDTIHTVSEKEQNRFITALGNAREQKAIPIISEFLSNSQKCLDAIRALIEIGDTSVYHLFIPFLITNDDRWGVRDAVQEALKKEPNYHTLKEALSNENQAICIEAALLLCEQGQQEGSQILLDAIHTVSETEQERFITVLGHAREQKAIPIISEFLSNSQQCLSAISALIEIGDTSVYHLFIPFLITNDGSWGVRDAVQKALKKEPNYHTLKEALSNENQAIRIEAALLLCEQGQQEGSQILLDAIHTVSETEQERIVNFLFTLIVNNDKTIAIISSILNAIPLAIIIRNLKSSESKTRQKCAIILGKGKVTKAVPYLIEALDDHDFSTRAGAAKALGLIGDFRAEIRLSEVIQNDSYNNVKIAAIKALNQIRDKKTNA
jgi:HEAT repeat protein